MKIKVGDNIYDGREEPLMIILTDRDKQNIANMHPESTMYCQFPDGKFTMEEIDAWMGPSPTGKTMEEMGGENND